MKTTFLSALLCLLISYNLSAQVDIPFFALSWGYQDHTTVEGDARIKKINYKGEEYTIRVDGSHDYTLLDKDNIVLVKGQVNTGRCVGQQFNIYGRWTSYYPNGNIKANGTYKDHHAVGYWETFYQDGNIKEAYFLLNNHKDYYTSYKDGPYYSYYNNGEISSYGWYKPRIDTTLYDTIYVDDPVTGETTMLTSKGVLRSFKVGTWYYYSEKGELLRQEDH